LLLCRAVYKAQTVQINMHEKHLLKSQLHKAKSAQGKKRGVIVSFLNLLWLLSFFQEKESNKLRILKG
jgi:hypothetical protein